MKTKIFALIISILCLSLIFVACNDACEAHVDENADGSCDVCGEAVKAETESETESETETEGVCEHKDEDANKVCDNCGKAVINIVEQIPIETETAAPMVVNPIPEGAVDSDYINTTLPAYDNYTLVGKVDGYENRNDVFALTKTVAEGITTYKIIDVSGDTFKDVYTVSDRVDGDNEIRHTVTLSDYWFTVKTETFGKNALLADVYDVLKEYTIDVYTYAGDHIGEQYKYIAGSADTDPVITQNTTLGANTPELYVSYQDKVFVIDENTDKLIYTSNPETLVERPEMDYVVGTTGYIFKQDGGSDYIGIYAYDLTKWIECTYSYTFPSEYQYVYPYLLQNGTVLVTAEVELPDSAVSYDYISGGDKYDLVYEIVDVAAKTVTPVEFGYYIEDIWAIEPDDNMFTDKAVGYNYAVVYPIVEGYVDFNTEIQLIIGNDLSIAAQSDIDIQNGMVWLVADNTFLKPIWFNVEDYSNSPDAFELVDINGKHIGYLPVSNASNYMDGYIKVLDAADNLVALNKYDGTELVSFEGYTVESFFESSYVHLSKEIDDGNGGTVTEHYIYIFGGEIKKIENTNAGWTIRDAYEYGYEVTYTYTDTETSLPVTVYELYNANGQLIFKSEGAIYDLMTSMIGDNMIIYTYGGEAFIIK